MLKNKRKGAGGIFFITITAIMALILTYTIRFSLNAFVSAVINNLAHVSCTEVAMYSYQTGEISGMKSGGSVFIDMPPAIDGTPRVYNVLNKFNERIGVLGSYITSPSENCIVIWNEDSRTAELVLGSVKTSWGAEIYPRTQMVIIEDE